MTDIRDLHEAEGIVLSVVLSLPVWLLLYRVITVWG